MIESLPVEPATLEDLPAVSVLLQDVELPRDGVEPIIENFLIVRSPVAVAGPQILIGCIGFELYGKSALLRSFAVHPDFQKQGLGGRLFLAALDKARNLQIKQLYLLTETAEAFFRKRRFVTVDRASVPGDVRDSIEFATLCPTATAMKLQL